MDIEELKQETEEELENGIFELEEEIERKLINRTLKFKELRDLINTILVKNDCDDKITAEEVLEYLFLQTGLELAHFIRSDKLKDIIDWLSEDNH